MRRQSGFTLIELIMVIVLLSIVATISVQFVTQSTQGAIDTSARQQRALTGAVISEQISRALRGALPRSVRTNGSCIEWMPVLAASNYLNLPLSAAKNTFDSVPLASGSPTAGRIAVYPDSGDLYDASLPNPGPLSPPASVTGNTVTFDGGATFQFSADSPRKRFFLVSGPRTICPSAAGNFLYRYQGYGIRSSIPSSADDVRVLAANVVSGSVRFTIKQPTLQRAAVVTFEFTLKDPGSDETMAVSQEVQIRNVP